MKNLDLNKLIGAFCVAGLVFLFGKWAATSIFSRHEPHAAHGSHEVAQAYTIEVEAGDGHSEAPAALDVGALMASADPAKGENVFKKCKACHTVDGTNGTGPHLDGVVNRTVASVAGFSYSDGMSAFGGEWTPERLVEFLGNVKGTVPGTKMSFAGLKDPQQSADLIAYLTPNFNAGDYSASAVTTDESHGDEGETHNDSETVATTAALVGDVAKGEKIFKKCKACHSVEAGNNGTGPSLAGVVGKPAGLVDGFKYSDAMINSGITWDEANLFKFLGDVKGTVPGTKMSFAGLKKEDQRTDLIAYLATIQ